VQLDKTLIVIRERGVFDTLDLALQVFRRHLPPLLLALALLAVPCGLLNHWAIGWLVVTDPDAPLLEDQIPGLIRFTWTMILLVTLEAPLATSLVTMYLGKAVFQEAPLLREILRESRVPLAQVVFCHLLLRGVLPAFLLVFLVDRAQGYSFPELLLVFLVLAVLVRRLVAPFLNEVVLLERNPLRSRHPGNMTAAKRSAALHAANPGALINLGFVVAVVAVLLTLATFGTCLCGKGIFLDDWSMGPGMFVLAWPFSLWLTAGFLAVVRFLAYLDLRISNEGWEVELRMRAEGLRVTELLR
jgi:hypothetical protein